MTVSDAVENRIRSLHLTKQAQNTVLETLQHPLPAGALLGGGLGIGLPALLGMGLDKSLWGGYLGSLLGAFGPPLAEEYGPQFKNILEVNESLQQGEA